MALVLDTGVLYASLDEADDAHIACAELIESSPEQLVLPCPVLVELDYWLAKLAPPDVWLTFCELVHDGAYTLYPLDDRLLVAAAGLQARFADQALGLVDAAVAVTCEALGEDKVATLDRRHFSVIRIGDDRALRILPE